jgi:hypothetical protein
VLGVKVQAARRWATPARSRRDRSPVLRHALFLTRAHNRLLRDGLAELADPPPAAPSKIRTAARAYETAIDDLLTRAGIAA